MMYEQDNSGQEQCWQEFHSSMCLGNAWREKKTFVGATPYSILVHIVLLNLTWHCEYARATA